MKRIAVIFALFFMVALIFPPEAPAPIVTIEPYLATECPEITTECPETMTECPAPMTECYQKETECPAPMTECMPKETECPVLITVCSECPGNCYPRTQGFWKRICDGVYGEKQEHPETPEGFSSEVLCDGFKGSPRSDPCVRAASQISALKLNNMYGMLDDSCKVYYDDKEMTVGDVLDEIDSLECKEAADLAEAINSGDAL